MSKQHFRSPLLEPPSSTTAATTTNGKSPAWRRAASALGYPNVARCDAFLLRCRQQLERVEPTLLRSADPVRPLGNLALAKEPDGSQKARLPMVPMMESSRNQLLWRTPPKPVAHARIAQ